MDSIENQTSDQVLNDKVAEEHKKEIEEKVVKENLPPENVRSLSSDKDLRAHDKKSLADHNEQYTRLLEAYVDNTKSSMKFKEYKKYDIFDLSMILFIGVPIAMVVIVFTCLLITALNPEIGALDVLPEILAAFGSVIATYFTIIKLITGYLFNKKEEKMMENIITKIQEYDSTLRGN
ncbi:MAG: hypothetical protein J6K58_06870 [Lachnospiraceae bacterium]|nr:hypothetical protein [Lachnospiraceae bacterium]MBP3458914.1 hypothetical protein [Lachnospiraceae bacterium]